MLKFRCQHCGQRIAVPARHLGKLVTCGECGAATHPVAQGLVESSKVRTEPQVAPTAEVPATGGGAACDNCGRPVGRLQSRHPWNGHQVCGPCLAALQTDSSHATGALATVIAPVRRTESAQQPAERGVNLKERTVRALVVFVVAVVALYGALSLLRDIAGLIAVVSVAILALLALFAVFRGAVTARQKAAAATEPHPKVISARTAA